MFAIGFLFIAGIVALVTLSSILSGWVLTILWGWFLVPFGIQQIGIAHGIGLCLVGRLMMGGANGHVKEDKSEPPTDRFLRSLGVLVGVPLFVLLVGWIVKGFM